MTFASCAFAVCVVFSFLGTAAAQDRMPPIPKDKMTDAQKKAADELVAGPRGAVAGPFVPLLRSPELMSRLQKTGEYLRFHNSIGQKLTEFVILLTARQWTQQYEYNVHAPLALKAGVKPEFVTAIAEGRRPAGMAADEEVRLTSALSFGQNQSVTDATYARSVRVWRAGRGRHVSTCWLLRNVGDDYECGQDAYGRQGKTAFGSFPALIVGTLTTERRP